MISLYIRTFSVNRNFRLCKTLRSNGQKQAEQTKTDLKYIEIGIDVNIFRLK